MHINFHNEFHGTVTSVTAEPIEGRPGVYWVSPWRMRSVAEHLCGIEGCECQGVQMRRPWVFDVQPDGSAVAWVEESS